MSDNENDGQEKTLEASEQKLRKAREKGDIPISTEVNTLMFYIGAYLTVVIFGTVVGMGVLSILAGMLERPEFVSVRFLGADENALSTDIFGRLGMWVLPLFGLPAIFVILSLIAQRAIVFAPNRIKPQLNKLSPLANAKKKYGPGGLGEFAKSFAKLALVSLIVGLFLNAEFKSLPAFSGLSASLLPGLLAQKGLKLLFYVMIGAAFIAVIDLPAKILAHQKKMRMTLQEAKDERKESEGDPYQKQRRRQKAQEIANTTMLQDVTGASVILVNPTHYAVALAWDRSSGDAPKCVAKGVDNMAFRIRERAKLAGVVIYENPPIARALYAKTNIGDIIAPEHYAAVAAAIHYADQVTKRGF